MFPMLSYMKFAHFDQIWDRAWLLSHFSSLSFLIPYFFPEGIYDERVARIISSLKPFFRFSAMSRFSRSKLRVQWSLFNTGNIVWCADLNFLNISPVVKCRWVHGANCCECKIYFWFTSRRHFLVHSRSRLGHWGKTFSNNNNKDPHFREVNKQNFKKTVYM